MIKDHCGVVAVSSSEEESLEITYNLMRFLQHRGQEAAGISYLNGDKIITIKGLGLVDRAIPREITALSSTSSVGHVRYSTSGIKDFNEVQPMGDEKLVVAFNGTIANYKIIDPNAKVDTEVIYKTLKSSSSIVDGFRELSNRADGGYSVVVMDSNETIYAYRDAKGFRPLYLGKLGKTLIIASEDSVILQLGGLPIRDVRPGELLIINKGKMISSLSIAKDTITTCAFEYIYFSRADSTIDSINVYSARIRIGEILAKYHPAEADVIVPVPDSSRPIALGYSRITGIPYEEALVRTVGAVRSFIMPTDDLRKATILEKFGVVKGVIDEKSVVLIDDSIVRGNTLKIIIGLLRKNGAKSVHVRVGSPMIRYPCYMGIDFPTQSELIAYKKDEKGIAEEIGADDVEYLRVEELVEAIGRRDLCLACFTGNYPLRDKYNLRMLEKMFTR